MHARTVLAAISAATLLAAAPAPAAVVNASFGLATYFGVANGLLTARQAALNVGDILSAGELAVRAAAVVEARNRAVLADNFNDQQDALLDQLVAIGRLPSIVINLVPPFESIPINGALGAYAQQVRDELFASQAAEREGRAMPDLSGALVLGPGLPQEIGTPTDIPDAAGGEPINGIALHSGELRIQSDAPGSGAPRRLDAGAVYAQGPTLQVYRAEISGVGVTTCVNLGLVDSAFCVAEDFSGVIPEPTVLEKPASSSGTLGLLDDGEIEAELIAFGPDAELRGTGALIGDVVNAGGLIAIGASPGVIDVTGDFFNVGGLLEMEIGGYDPALADLLTVGGEAFFGDGEMWLSFTEGFAPAADDVFTLVTASKIALSDAFALKVMGLDDTMSAALTVTPEGLGVTVSRVTVAPIPLPPSFGVLAFGIAALLGQRKARPGAPRAARALQG